MKFCYIESIEMSIFCLIILCHLLAAEDVNVSVSSVAANLQQLNVHDDRGLSPEGDGPSVVIPDHLQVQTADCSHLSFGSFGAGIGGSFSGPLASAPVKTSLEDAPKDVEGSSVGHLGSRYTSFLTVGFL